MTIQTTIGINYIYIYKMKGMPKGRKTNSQELKEIYF
jgi:hypothetical protein